MGHDVFVSDAICIQKKEIEWSFVRSSGPGGQNVNKVNSKAVMRWNVAASPSLPEGVRHRFLAKYANRINQDGQLILTSQRHRDQPQNVSDCIGKLRRLILAVEQPPRRRRRTKPSRAAVRRRLENKRRIGQKKQQRTYRPDPD